MRSKRTVFLLELLFCALPVTLPVIGVEGSEHRYWLSLAGVAGGISPSEAEVGGEFEGFPCSSDAGSDSGSSGSHEIGGRYIRRRARAEVLSKSIPSSPVGFFFLAFVRRMFVDVLASVSVGEVRSWSAWMLGSVCDARRMDLSGSLAHKGGCRGGTM